MAAWLSQRVVWRKESWLWSYPIVVHRVCSRGVGDTFSAPGIHSTTQDNPRTVENLPRVSFWKMLYRLTFQGFLKRMHELQIYEKQLYGPIFMDGANAVCVNTPKLLEEVLRNDDKFPCRGNMESWTDYRDLRGYGYGPFTLKPIVAFHFNIEVWATNWHYGGVTLGFGEGEKWYNLRSVLNKRMLHPRDCADYAGILNDIVTDFMRRMCYLRECSPTGDLVTDINNELYHFSLEATAAILFETRLGCLEKGVPTETQDFIDAIAKMFSNNLSVIITPKWSRNILPYWGRYIAGWDGIFSFAQKLIDKKMEFIQQLFDNNQDVEGGYLTYLLSKTQMSLKDVCGSVTELLLAGVDTTSTTLTWTLHLLSMHPQCQDRLYEEVSMLQPAGQMPSAEEVTKMPYLRAVIKESLRVHPVVPMTARHMTDRNATIGGYQIPKGTTVKLCFHAISHDEDTFPEPFTFKPERWLHDGRQRPNAFGSLPFGFGVRGCVGRRIAELEMFLALFQLIKRFEFRPDPTMGELKAITRTVMIPDKPLSLHFVDRGGENTA